MTPRSDDDDSLRCSWFPGPGYREIYAPQRPFSFVEEIQNNDRSDRTPRAESPHPGTSVHVETLRLDHPTPPPPREKPRNPLKSETLRQVREELIGAVRKLGSKRRTSSSNPETAPNRSYTHVSLPLHDSSSTETIRAQPSSNRERAAQVDKPLPPPPPPAEKAKRTTTIYDLDFGLTRQDTFLELTELMQVRTASSVKTLQRLADVDSQLDAVQRKALLKIARAAANVARREHNRVLVANPPGTALAGKLPRNTEVPLADVREYREYLDHLEAQAKQLEGNVRGLDVFEEALNDVRRVRSLLDMMSGAIDRKEAEAEMAEIRWLVQRKSMYWEAVDVIKARLDGGITMSRVNSL